MRCFPWNLLTWHPRSSGSSDYWHYYFFIIIVLIYKSFEYLNVDKVRPHSAEAQRIASPSGLFPQQADHSFEGRSHRQYPIFSQSTQSQAWIVQITRLQFFWMLELPEGRRFGSFQSRRYAETFRRRCFQLESGRDQWYCFNWQWISHHLATWMICIKSTFRRFLCIFVRKLYEFLELIIDE